jgi:hypothetical protein
MFSSDICIIVGGKNKIYSTYLPAYKVPSYLLKGQIAESETGNKEYFNISLINMTALLVHFSHQTVGVLVFLIVAKGVIKKISM